jgi:hypothetical protein
MDEKYLDILEDRFDDDGLLESVEIIPLHPSFPVTTICYEGPIGKSKGYIILRRGRRDFDLSKDILDLAFDKKDASRKLAESVVDCLGNAGEYCKYKREGKGDGEIIRIDSLLSLDGWK